jgi:two-component system, LytTR family, response regulator AlgR
MTQELRVFIADDEPPARSRLKELLADVAGEVPTRVVGEAANGMETLERLPGSGATVLFLDIQMPGMGGLELARHLALLPAAPAIVFVTAHDEHALQAFELNALDYLMKPVRAQRLVTALRKARAARAPDRERLGAAAGLLEADTGRGREHLAVAERNRIVLVPVRDILFLKAEQKYVTLRTREREHLVEESLVSLEREFAGQFVRVHRNCLVARGAIRGFERLEAPEGDEAHWLVVLDGVDEKIPVSRRQWPAVRATIAES